MIDFSTNISVGSLETLSTRVTGQQGFSYAGTLMRICLITTFPPSRHHLSEYGYHLAEELRRQNIDFTILGDVYAPEQSDQSELPGFEVRRCWQVGAVGN